MSASPATPSSTNDGRLSASEIDRIAANRADATRLRSSHVGRAMLALLFFPALGWLIAVAFGKPLAMVAVGVGLLAAPACLGYTVAALIAGGQEQRALLDVDRALSTHDLRSMENAPLELPLQVGDYVLEREADGVRGTMIGSRLGVIFGKIGLVICGVLVAAAVIWIASNMPHSSWRLARFIEGPGVYLLGLIGVAAGLPLLISAFSSRALSWTVTRDGLRLRQMIAIFGVTERTVPTALINELLVVDTDVEVRTRDGVPLRILSPAPLKLDPRAGAVGLYEKRIAQHRAMAQWQAQRVACLLNAILARHD